MYESPIQAIYEDVQNQFEDCVFKTIQKVNITVNREELIKALQYDRGQYEKGLADAVKHGRWEDADDDETMYKCSVCGELSCCRSPFCGECGAKMDEVEE